MYFVLCLSLKPYYIEKYKTLDKNPKQVKSQIKLEMIGSGP